MAEEFEWKAPKDIWKGVGIYHITFVVAGRKRLLGELVEIPHGSKGENTIAYDGDVTRPQDNEGLMPDNAQLPYEGWLKELSTSELATVRLSPLGTAILHDLLRLPARYADSGTSDEEKPLKICAKQFMDNRPVIGDNVTFGVNVTIIGSVKIGNNVTIGAGSVVVKDIPDNSIAVGNPCRVIKTLE